jgi:phosphate transport system permease protein
MTSLRHNILFRYRAINHHPDDWFRLSLMLTAALAVGVLLLIFLFLASESWPAIQRLGVQRFFTDDGWHPLEGAFNLTPMLMATLLASFGAIFLATPLGIISAVFGRYYAPKSTADIFRRIVSLLAGIPSVIFGLWGLTVLVPLVARFEPPGASLIAAMMILALMILPTVIITADAALKSIPDSYLLCAAALGLSKTGAIINVALPAARSGIIGGILLATARALGETMAVLMVAGNVVQMPGSLFDSVRVLTSNIALEMAYAASEHRAVLFVSGLILMILVIFLAMLAGKLGGRLHG